MVSLKTKCDVCGDCLINRQEFICMRCHEDYVNDEECILCPIDERQTQIILEICDDHNA